MGGLARARAHEQAGRSPKKLIAAVVAHIDHASPPPKDLVLVWDMERWGALPDSGGILDQDAEIMNRSRVLQSVYKTVNRLRNMKGAEIHKLTDGERRVIGNLKRAGYL